MQFNELNEIIEENSLPTISKRTRVSVKNLEALLNRDWARLKKVQALGFISILEREYHLDLNEMRADCRAYYETHASLEEEIGSVITPAPEPQRRGPSKTLITLVLLLAALGAYWLFSSPADGGGERNATAFSSSERAEGFFDSVLTTAKGWFGAGEEPETALSSSTEELPVVQGAWALKPAAGVNASSEPKPKEPSQANPPAPRIREANNNGTKAMTPIEEKEEAQIITQVKKEQAKAEAMKQQAEEENLSGVWGKEGISEISKMILAATAGTDATAKEKPLEAQVPSMSSRKRGAKSVETAQPAEAATRKEGDQESVATAEAVNSALVIMHPRSKIWVGYTDLRTMKRTAKVTADDLSFDTASGDYILAVGHGLIDFKTRKGEMKLSDGKRHFFMIAKGEVREISHEEFQRLNKSKVW